MGSIRGLPGFWPSDREVKAIDFTRMFDWAHFDIIIWVISLTIKTENRISEKFISKAWFRDHIYLENDLSETIIIFRINISLFDDIGLIVLMKVVFLRQFCKIRLFKTIEWKLSLLWRFSEIVFLIRLDENCVFETIKWKSFWDHLLKTSF